LIDADKALGIRQERDRRRRRLAARARALDQNDPELLLELADLLRDRRLRELQPVRRGLKAPALDQRGLPAPEFA
jgi:hypothetical protein